MSIRNVPVNYSVHRYRTYSEFCEAVTDKFDALFRMQSHVKHGKKGDSYMDNYLKSVLDMSLLCRMFVSDASGTK